MSDALRYDRVSARANPAMLRAQDLRGAPRYTLLIRAAKLICQQGEFMCVVRDASETGVNVRLFHALPDCAEVVLELQNGDRHEAEVMWQADDRAGLQFAHAADIARIIESPSRFSRRPVRVKLSCDGVIATGGAKLAARIVDISQQGARISCPQFFAIDQRVKLSASGLPEVNAKVRWRDGENYGLVFEDTFQFGDLARTVALLQQAALR